jgi:hypothetical protein
LRPAGYPGSDVEDAVLQIALDERIHFVQWFDIMIVRLAERRQHVPFAKIDDRVDMDWPSKRERAVDGINGGFLNAWPVYHSPFVNASDFVS